MLNLYSLTSSKQISKVALFSVCQLASLPTQLLQICRVDATSCWRPSTCACGWIWVADCVCQPSSASSAKRKELSSFAPDSSQSAVSTSWIQVPLPGTPIALLICLFKGQSVPCCRYGSVIVGARSGSVVATIGWVADSGDLGINRLLSTNASFCRNTIGWMKRVLAGKLMQVCSLLANSFCGGEVALSVVAYHYPLGGPCYSTTLQATCSAWFNQ